jgi:cytoskeleton protein RodZ
MDHETKESPVLEPSPGNMLRVARTKAGMSLEQVAEHLRLSPGYIHALENDEYEKLPDEPFVLGYFRAYAKLVQISPDSLVHAYRQYRAQLQHTVDQVVQPRQANAAMKLDDKSIVTGGNLRYVIVVVALLLATAVGWFLMSETGKSTIPSNEASQPKAVEINEPEPEPAPAVEPAVEPVVETAAATEQVTADTGPAAESAPVEVAAGAEGPTTTTVAEDSSPQSSIKPVAVQPLDRTATAGLDVLEISFSSECWLEVTDSNGDVVAANLYQPGERATLQGVAPFSVMFGNVRGVSVTLNGETVATVPDGDRKTLRTTIGR